MQTYAQHIRPHPPGFPKFCQNGVFSDVGSDVCFNSQEFANSGPKLVDDRLKLDQVGLSLTNSGTNSTTSDGICDFGPIVENVVPKIGSELVWGCMCAVGGMFEAYVLPLLPQISCMLSMFRHIQGCVEFDGVAPPLPIVEVLV